MPAAAEATPTTRRRIRKPAPVLARRGRHIDVAAVALALALAGGLLFNGGCMIQDRMLFFPTRAGAADIAGVLSSSDANGATLREWTADGEWLGFVAEPRVTAAPSGVTTTALVFHGNAGWAGDRLYYVAPLVRRGWRVVLAEYPGYGARAGTATVENVLASTGRDIESALQCWPGRLVIVGESLGAGLVAQHAKRFAPRVAGLVLVTPWDSLRAVAKMHYGWLPVDLLVAHPLDSVAALQGFAGPVSVLVAGRDEIVGAAGGRKLAAAVNGSTLVELPGAGHNDWLLAMSDPRWDALLAPVVAAR